MPYDIDILVLGAGPAGMAAAIRARWLRAAEAIPASVALLDPAGCGGIAAMGDISLTGPAFHFTGTELVERLTEDIARLEIPVLREAARHIARQDDCWEVRTPARTLRCLAVVAAVGLRRLSNEAEVRRAGLLDYFSGGYARAAARFTGWSAGARGQRLVIIGGEGLRTALADFQHADAGHNSIEALCEPRQVVSGFRLDAGCVIVAVEEEGARREIACDRVMLDYHSLQLAPPAPAFLPPEMRDAAGYCLGRPAIPGLFAAGDCAGPPSLCVKALAQGTEAGFAAYRYVYARKFGHSPDLFAFYPSPTRPAFDTAALPTIDPARFQPVGLIAASAFPHALSGEMASSVNWEQVGREIAEKTATVHLALNTGSG